MWKTGNARAWVLLIIVYGAVFTVAALKCGFLFTRTEGNNSNSSSTLDELLRNPVEELVQRLREATAKAKRSESISISSAASCKSRHLLPLFYNGRRNKKKSHNSEFAVVFKAYSDLHRACVNRKSSQNLTLLFHSNHNGPDHSSGCKFLVVEFGRHHGIGNKLLWLVSAFLYSILTQRVILIDTRFTIDKILCEPFVGSSWKLPDDFPYSDSESDEWMKPDEFFEQSFPRNGRLQELRESGPSKDQRLRRLGDDLKRKAHAVRLNVGWDVEKRCFCEAEHAVLENVEWLGLARGCLYFVPGLFAAPKFRRTLESLFPETNPATHLLRHLVIPGDETWSKVEQVWRSQSNKVSFGAQVRYRDVLMFLVRNRTVNTRITRCAVENGLLPSSSENHGPSSQDQTSWMVFIASLFNGLHTHLQSVYSEFNRTHSMQLVQLSSKQIQLYDVDGDTQALAEIISLSFSNSLATTPRSTFGYIAQSLAGMKPWLVNFGGDNIPKQQECIRGQSSEPCYQTATERSKCRFDDTAEDGIHEPLPYVSKCQDDPTGYQLISS